MFDHFEKETGLKIRYDYNSNKHIEISGKSYKYISNKIGEYNRKYNCNVSCFDDIYKDCTYIVF